MKVWVRNRTHGGRLWMAGILLIALAIASLLSLIGCGGSGSGLAPLPTFVPGSVSDSDRQDADAAIQTLFDSVYGQPDAAAQLVAKMKTMKQFAFAEISESGDAVGWFTDGHTYACITTDPPVSAQPMFKAQNDRTTAKPKDIPGAPTAYFVNAFEPLRPDVGASVAPLLNAKGYNVVQLGGKVTDWATISNAGLLFVHAHGLVETDDYRVPHFWYSTSQAPSPDLDTQYDAYWNNSTICVGRVQIWDTATSSHSELRYLVSDKFLHNSGMSFAKNGVWISQSCTSYNGYMLNAVIDPSSGFPNVDVYAGWTGEEDSWESSATSAFIFDRMLGVNQAQPVDPDNPPPSTFNKLRDVLATTTRTFGGELYDESTIGHKKAFFKIVARPGTNVPTIIPVITGTSVDNDALTLTLDGSFGVPEGSVTINGTPLAVHTWSETSVVVDLPTESTGTLVARSLGDSSSSGYLLSNAFDYKGLVVGITPPGGVLDPSEKKTFTVAPTSGTLPQATKYRWTLVGKGSLAGGSPQVTSNNSVNYTAPTIDTTDSLKVEVLNQSGSVAAKAVAAITVGAPSMVYTVTGDVSQQMIPHFADGSFKRPFFASFHVAQSGQDNGIVEFVDPTTTDSMMIVLTLSPGAHFSVGQTFVYTTNGPGGFHLLPGTGHSNYIFNGFNKGGNLTITSVKDNGDGTFLIGFTETISDDIGCTIAGSGSFEFHYSYDSSG